MTRRALVTGATGFVGAVLLRRLVADGWEVSCLVRGTSSTWRIAEIPVEKHIADLLEPSSLAAIPDRAFQGVVFHMAAAAPLSSAAKLAEANVQGTLALLRRIVAAGGCERLIYPSTGLVYGAGERLTEDARPQPISPYAVSKLAAEHVCHAYDAAGVPSMILRLFTTYGPFDAPGHLIPDVALAGVRGRDVPLTSGEQSRDLVHVDDTVAALIAAARSGGRGATINVCTGNATRVRDVADLVLKHAGTGARALVGALRDRPNETPVLSGDPTRMTSLLGVRPRPLEEGIEQTLAWYRANSHLFP